jgi:hypothetical protein
MKAVNTSNLPATRPGFVGTLGLVGHFCELIAGIFASGWT